MCSRKYVLDLANHAGKIFVQLLFTYLASQAPLRRLLQGAGHLEAFIQSLRFRSILESLGELFQPLSRGMAQGSSNDLLGIESGAKPDGQEPKKKEGQSENFLPRALSLKEGFRIHVSERCRGLFKDQQLSGLSFTPA